MSLDVTLPTLASEQSELQQVQLCVTLAASGYVGWLCDGPMITFCERKHTNKQTCKKKKKAAAVAVCAFLGLQHLREVVHGDSWMLQCCTPALQTASVSSVSFFLPYI